MFCVGASVSFPPVYLCDYLVYQHICVLSHTSGSDTFDTETSESGHNSFNTATDIDTLIVSLSQVRTQ